MGKSNMPNMSDDQAENLIRQSLTNRMDREPERPSTFFAIQDRLNEQDGPSLRKRLSGISELALWRFVPVSKQRMAQALVLVAIAVVVGSYVAFAGSDDATESGSATEATAAPEPTAEPAVPEATPIAKLTVPDELVPFEDLSGFSMWDSWVGDKIRMPPNWQGPVPTNTLQPGASDEQVASLIQQQVEQTGFAMHRMLLLIYAPGIDPLVDGSPFVMDLDFQPVWNTADSWPLSATGEGVIIVEEFAFCGDGRGVYLQHSEKPVEIGETFAWDIYTTLDDPLGDFHLVMTAEPDSPITHDGPDPKKLDLKMKVENHVVTADLGVKLVGMMGRDPAVVEMCRN